VTLEATSFRNLSYVETLSIRYVPTLRSVESGTFGPLKRLNDLELCHNKHLKQLSDAAFDGIIEEGKEADWPVKKIYLNDNALTHINHTLAPWEHVDFIFIEHNPFVCDCNLEWMVTNLVHYIITNQPPQKLNCYAPENLRGTPLKKLLIEPEPLAHCISRDENTKEEYENLTDSVKTAGVTILVIGIMCIVVGLSILGVLIVKRRAIAMSLMAHQQIRYERASSEVSEDYQTEYDFKYGQPTTTKA